jgi:hypothetical protein
LAAGEFDEALAELDSVTVPTTTVQAEQLDGMLALSRSLVAAADKRPADVDAPLEYADELATRTREGNAYWLGFGPTNDPGGLFALHEAILSWRQARWLVRVRSSGWPFHHALSRIRLRATAA